MPTPDDVPVHGEGLVHFLGRVVDDQQVVVGAGPELRRVVGARELRLHELVRAGVAGHGDDTYDVARLQPRHAHAVEGHDRAAGLGDPIPDLLQLERIGDGAGDGGQRRLKGFRPLFRGARHSAAF